MEFNNNLVFSDISYSRRQGIIDLRPMNSSEALPGNGEPGESLQTDKKSISLDIKMKAYLPLYVIKR